MRRTAFIGATIASWIVLAETALAQDGSDLGAPEGPEVLGRGGSAGGVGGAGTETAFTGVEIAGLIVLAVVLLAIGALLIAGRTSFDADVSVD